MKPKTFAIRFCACCGDKLPEGKFRMIITDAYKVEVCIDCCVLWEHGQFSKRQRKVLALPLLPLLEKTMQ